MCSYNLNRCGYSPYANYSFHPQYNYGQNYAGTNAPSLYYQGRCAQPPKQQNDKMSLSSKILLGLGAIAAIGIGVMAHKHITNTPEKLFSTIFKREIPTNEATKMLEKYKEIYKIEDKKSFAETMFRQLQKDYGFTNTPFTLKYTNLRETEKAVGICKMGSSEILLDAQHLKGGSKMDIANTLAHELRHAQQNKALLRVGKEKFVDARWQSVMDKLKAKYPNDIKEVEEIAKKESEKVYDRLQRLYGAQSIVTPTDTEYTYINKLLEDLNKDKNCLTDFRFTERDARKAGSAMSDILMRIEHL